MDQPDEQQKIARLEQRLESQEYRLQQQSQRIEALEEELSQADSRLVRLAQLDEQMDRFKSDVLNLIQRQQAGDGRPPPAPSLTEPVETQAKAFHELRRDLDKVSGQQEQIALARTEVERLNKTVAGFEAQLDTLEREIKERLQPLTYLQEQRRSDARLLTELQTELPDLQKKVEDSRTKIQLLEQQLPQFGKYEIAIEEMRNDIRHYREQLDFQAAERERQMKQWAEMAEAQQRRTTEFRELMEKYAEHYQLNKRTLASLQEFQERLQREQHHTADLQRLSEERHWAALEKWQTDYEQRWRKQSIEWKPQLADLRRDFSTLQKQLNQMEQANQTLEDEIKLILQIIEEDLQFRTQAVQQWQNRLEEIATQD